jgi:hypothetical protein
MKLFSLISLVAMAIASNARKEPAIATRLNYGNPVCIRDNVIADKAAAASALDTYRDDHVKTGDVWRGKYFNKKLAFKAVKFDKPNRQYPRACADLCLLDHRVDANQNFVVTDCSGGAIDGVTGLPADQIGAELCGMTTGDFTPQGRCTTFTYDKRRKQCRLYDATVTPSEYNMKTASGKDTGKVNTYSLECSMLDEDDEDDIMAMQ